MLHRCTVRFLLIIALSLLGSAPGVAQPASYQVAEVGDGGSVTGRVSYSGTAPAVETLVVSSDNEVCGTEKPSRVLLIGPDGGIENTVVHIRTIKSGKAWPQERHTLGQDDCRFEPHILLMNPEADLYISNTDRIAHNVRSYGQGPVFNVGQPKFVETLFVENLSAQVANPDVIRIGCDLHPWMSAYIVIKEHPYYVVTGPDGSFELTNVPPGKYELRVWHETLGEVERAVTVKANEATEINFEMSR